MAERQPHKVAAWNQTNTAAFLAGDAQDWGGGFGVLHVSR